MRLKVRHETRYRFDVPPSGVTQTLRLTPRSHDGQHVVRWRLDVDRNCRLRTAEDAFGNHTHIFSIDGPVSELAVLVEGEIDTQDAGGVVRGAVERFPPALYLRESDLTAPDADIAAFAEEACGALERDPLEQLHALLRAVHERMAFVPGETDAATTAVEAFRLGRGVCQDLTHVFLAAARKMGIPARYVGGYLWRAADDDNKFPAHAWAEAHVPDLGWVGFDPSCGLCSTDAHVRVAIGLDRLGAAPIRGARYGGQGETLVVSIEVADGGRPRAAFRRA